MRSFAVALLLALASSHPTPTVAQDARAQDDEATQRAIILFEESETAYNAGEFTEAAALLRRAYTLHPDPTLLFNLARALEGDGDLEGAIEAYERYVEDAPDATDRGAVEARVQTLREQRDQLAQSQSHPEPDPDAESQRSGEGPQLGGWLVGLALVGGGIGFGVASQNLSDDADTEPVQEDAKRLHDDAQLRATLANVFFVVGGVAVVGGVVWGILTWNSRSSDEMEVSLGVGSLHIRGRF